MRSTVAVDESRMNLVLEGLSYEEYAKMDAINAHGLMDVLESPAHYRWRLSAASEPSLAMKLGIQVDMMLFEPEEFAARYAIKERGLAEPGVEYITAIQMAKVQAIVAGVRANAVASDILAKGIPQPTVAWHDRIHNVPCKARLDFISFMGGRKVAVDLKTTADADPYKFQRKMAEYRYDLQAAHYLEAGRATKQFDADLFLFIVVQTKAPYTCFVFRAGEAVLSRGTLWRDHAMQIYTECMRQGDWPGPPQYQTIEMPYWAKTPDEEQGEQKEVADEPPPTDDEVEG